MRGLYALKPWYTRRLNRFVAAADRHNLSPDLFTAAGVLGAAAAGVFLALGWPILAAVALALRLAGANLDGAVARARGVSRPWGFVLNEIGDRFSDLLMFAGLVVLAARTGTSTGWGDTAVVVVLLAALAATTPTFASLAAAGAGATRRNGGPFGKTERCLAAVLAAAVPAWLVVISAIIIAGSLLTCALRCAGAYRELTRSAA